MNLCDAFTSVVCLTWIQMSRMMSVMSSINGHYCCVFGPRTADITVETRCSHALRCTFMLYRIYPHQLYCILLSTMRCALSAMTTATTTTTTTNGVVVDVVDGVYSVKY